MYIDPEPDPRLKQIKNIRPEKVVGAIYRISFAKELMAAGLWRTATHIERRQRQGDFLEPPLKAAEADLAFAGFIKSDQAWQRKLEYRSIEVDPMNSTKVEQTKEYARKTTLKIRVPNETVEFACQIIEMDSRGEESASDDLIARRSITGRKERVVSIQVHENEGDPFRKLTRKIESPWIEQALGRASASLTGPSGIWFELSRQDEN